MKPRTSRNPLVLNTLHVATPHLLNELVRAEVYRVRWACAHDNGRYASP